ncbi:MAG: PEP-CTERM sorting domain-containing protein [Rhodospirillaceae bacterium]|nr:PEP-CTERM sorting domain-containing protein [Rhodospirillaceae bacterium]
MSLVAGAAQATTILYNDFSSLAGLQVNGTTKAIHACAPSGDGATCGAVTDFGGNKVLRLTNNLSQAGSAFSTSTVSLASDASFSTSFRFRFTDQQNSGADGIVFAVQTVSNQAGGIGGGIGYFGINNSVGIEFDNWFNGGSDPDDNHVGVNINGSVVSVATAFSPYVFDDGLLLTAWVDYDGATDMLEVRLSNTNVRPLASLLSYNVDLATVLGTSDAYVGFTSGTGAAGADHDILAWQFNSTFNPIDQIGDVPTPGAMALLGAGLFALGWARRRYFDSAAKQ